MNARQSGWRRTIGITVCCLVLMVSAVCVGQEITEPIATLGVGGGGWAGHFSPDGECFAVACTDGTVKLFDTQTWDLIWESLVHEAGKTNWVRFSPDGDSLATAISGETDVIFLNPETGEEIRRFVLPDKTPSGRKYTEVSAFAFSPDGSLLACGNWSYGFVLVVDAETGDVLGTLAHSAAGEKMCPVFSPDGLLLASASGRSIMVWDVETEEGKSLSKVGIGHPQTVAFNSDGSILAAGGANSTAVLLWDTSTWEVTRLAANSRNLQAGGVDFSPDGRFFACGYKELKIWDASTLELLSTSPIGDNAATWIRFSPDGELLAISECSSRWHGPSPRLTIWSVADLVGE